MKAVQGPRLLVLCTVSTGLDAIAEVHRRGYFIAGLVGLNPRAANLEAISGYADIAAFAHSIGVPCHYVSTYSLMSGQDQALFSGLNYDVLWVAGWQRLVPGWLIEKSKLGVLGGHGSPDGIAGGRGRSPQNWALLLGCSQFDLALFRITEGPDEGPIVAQRTFTYRPNDDIQVSYYRSALAMADMVCEVLDDPERLDKAVSQPAHGFYYPQRRPEDGTIDWCQPAEVIARHCRALTTPYPGLRTTLSQATITITHCQPFDDQLDGPPGQISRCFHSGDFLVNVLDGRLLVRGWKTNQAGWVPRPEMKFTSVPFWQQLQTIVDRHMNKYPKQPIAFRILNQAKKKG